MNVRIGRLLIVLVAGADVLLAARERKVTESPLDQYIREAMGREAAPVAGTGSLWTPNAVLVDISRDLRARNVDDMVTILVAERASAVAKGNVKTTRQSSAKSNIAALAGPTKAKGALANLASVAGEQSLDGSATTSRETTLNTTLAARVTHVLPNGYLVVEGSKELQLNSERQLVTVRGVVRPNDLTSANVVRSDRLAQLEVRINGKGVVGDAIKRPFILYRILLGLLPF